jgi:hypothetical protein
MADDLTISKQSPAFPDYLDFQSLRAIGIDHLQQLSSDVWTDYNLHDPGITILEVLCYAVTDLGYRNTLDIQDLLALDPANPRAQENNFFTPNQILTNNPLTELDWRKRLIDIPGVRNAWIEKVTDVGDPVSAAEVEASLHPDGDRPPQLIRPALYANGSTKKLQFGEPDLPQHLYRRLNPRGLYDVCVDLDPVPRKDACGVVDRSRGKILDDVRTVLCQYRNLCEDFRDIIVLGEEEIAVCADIELTAAADPEDVLVAIYVAVQAFLAPRLRFYTLQELIAKGKTTAEIFAGRPAADLDDPATIPPDSGCPPYPDHTSLFHTPYHSHGFIDIDELEALDLPSELHTSDLYRIIMDVPGVAAIKKFSLINYINGLRQSEGHAWCLKLTDKHRPVLGVDQSTITFFKGDLPFKAQAAEVKQRYQEQQAAYIKAQKDPFELDFPVPRGTYYDLADHYSIHHDFPLTYGIGEDGLPNTVPAKRKAQAKQLKGYLLFFDQLLANYLAQLSHIRDLFSWECEGDRAPTDDDPDRRRTYFTQGLTNVPGADEIIKNFYRCPDSDLPGTPPIDYTAYLDFIAEDPQTYEARRHQFLDHLLARFAETFTDYVLLNYRLSDGQRRNEIDIINDKARFLQDYPVLGRDRGRGFNYCHCTDVWNSLNVSGFKKRVTRLLGIHDESRRNLSHYRVDLDPGGYQLRLTQAQPPLPASPENGDRPPASIPVSSTEGHLISRILYPREDVDATLAEWRNAALDPTRYRRLAYRSFHHYGWNVWSQEQAIATLTHFDRNPARTEEILADSLAILEHRRVPLSAAMIEQLTAAVSGVDSAAITIEDGALSLQVTTPARALEPDEEATDGAIAPLIAALMAALRAVFLNAEGDDGLIDRAFSAPILIANTQVNDPQAQLYATVVYTGSTVCPPQTAPSPSSEPQQQWVVNHPVVVTTLSFAINGAATPISQLEMPIADPDTVTTSATDVSRPIEPGAAILIRLTQDDSGDWGLYLNLPTHSASSLDSPDSAPPSSTRHPLAVLRERLAIALPTPGAIEAAVSIPHLTLTADADDLIAFDLRIPSLDAHTEALAFKGIGSQSSDILAKARAFQTLTRIERRDTYHSMQVQRADGTPEEFTYHGYGMIGTEGQLIAESQDRFLSPDARDRHLQRWLTGLWASHNRFRVEPTTACFFVELRDADGEEIWLQGEVGVSTREAAATQRTILLNVGQDRSAYEPTEETTDGDTCYSFGLRLGDRLLAHHPTTYLSPGRHAQPRYATALERDLWLDTLLYYLNQPAPAPLINGETGTYQATLLNREGQPILVTYHSYATRTLAEVAYQRLLYLASDPVYYQIHNDMDGDDPYGFSLIDRRGNPFATHPGRYPTACARDLAIRTLINYVNKDVDLQYPQREEGFYIELRDQDGTALLVSDRAYESEAVAEATAESILEFAAEESNYRLLDEGEADCPYGFALMVNDEQLATHPDTYALASERDQALQALITCILDEDPAYEIDGVEGRFSYALVDVLAAEMPVENATPTGGSDADSLAEVDTDATDPDIDASDHPSDAGIAEPDRPLLLTSAVLYPDAEAAQQAFNRFVSVGSDLSFYHRLDDLPAPQPYGFDLRNESGEVIARHQTAGGDLIGYSTELERDAAIAKVLYYLTRPAIQVSIVNPEGAFFAEIYDDQHDLIWRGERILPSPEAAAAEADLIVQVSATQTSSDIGDRDPYQPRTGAGTCPYSFDLVIEPSDESQTPPATEEVPGDTPTYEAMPDPAEAACDPDAPPDTGDSAAPASRVAIARHPRFYRSEAERNQIIQQLRLRFLDDFAQAIDIIPIETDTGTRYQFALPASDYCVFESCDADQQARFNTGSLLGPPLDDRTDAPHPTVTYATADAAQDQFRQALASAKTLSHFYERYDNQACATNDNAAPFSFELRASADGAVLAASPHPYRSRADMWSVIRWIHRLAQGCDVTIATPGSHCGFYFYLDVPAPNGAEPASLRSVNRYPSETHAWEAARAFAENLLFINRYLEPGDIHGTSYGFAIGNAAGTPLAITDSDLDPVELFQTLNDRHDQLHLISAEGEETGYRFQFVETSRNGSERVWLQGLTVHADEAAATTQFYRDVLGYLLEDGAIAPYDTPSGFSFRITAPTDEPEALPEVIALHPHPESVNDDRFYPTAAERDRAIAQLRVFIRTVGIDIQAHRIDPAFVGKIVGADDSVLLQATESIPATEANRDQQKEQAWKASNSIIELAQDRRNIRWIDDDDGTCLFSWELTDPSKSSTLGAPTAHYASEADREGAIARLQHRLNDEGFHLLEHILLRPQQLLPPPAPCDLPTDSASPSNPLDSESLASEFSGSESLNAESLNAEAFTEETQPRAIAQPSSQLEALLPISFSHSDGDEATDACLTSYDPYSFWMSVVLPYWPERFRDMNFRHFVERTLRLEAPAHVALKICWVNAYQMHQFDGVYRRWLEQFSLNACEGSACDLPGRLSDLIEILTQLENVYPQGTLHDCEESDPDDNPIILDQTALGTAEGA